MIALGNGDEEAGRDLIKRLAAYLVVARFKHLVGVRDYDGAFHAIESEVRELSESVHFDISRKEVLSPHTVDEAFDVLVTAVRLINGEFV